ncbi:MAG: rod shape-determining protein, partial [Finegoldia magna]|nr:rod shape-determining protein [Finegoldia magna]
MKLFKFQQEGLGIDLGTSNSIISDENGKIIINEPSVVAIDINNYDIVAVGTEAKSMIGKTPDNIVAISPIENGVIADFESTVSMLSYFIKKARPNFSVFQPEVCVSVSASLTDVERRSVEDLALNAGARSVKLVEENIASLKGLGVDVDEPTGHIILNIGAGTIEASVISLGGIVTSYCIKSGGEDIDQEIKQIL